MLYRQIMEVLTKFVLLLVITIPFISSTQPMILRSKKAINPFLDSMGKRAVNPFIDSIGKRAYRGYFDALAGQSLGKRAVETPEFAEVPYF
ncbi:hypothetical protein WR25_11772 [Diploscapter pachys]|uniref:Uncharacterized protein n=1 Tax=Diploscapter pachys TaxID=2018661 RepID=A0A2A2J8N3_9BILA|nr:hypothetical protein WR25_11772 [Diploscapter pachys]